MRTKFPKEDTRYVTKFLWFPIYLNGIYIWLEKVTIRQAHLNIFGFYKWCDVCLSNPLTGLPIDFDSPKQIDLLEFNMVVSGKYYVISEKPIKVEKR